MFFPLDKLKGSFVAFDALSFTVPMTLRPTQQFSGIWKGVALKGLLHME